MKHNAVDCRDARTQRCAVVLALAFSVVASLGAFVQAQDEAALRARAERAIVRGMEQLVSRQADDGGWHSTTYGQLKDGTAVTALVLYSFSFVPDELRAPHNGAIERGFQFFDAGLKKRGTLASPDGSLDFPTYAAAHWLTARRRLNLPAGAAEHQQVLDYLLTAQLAEDRGFERAHVAYGGWDFLGAGDAQGITTGSNISVTSYVLEALAAERGDKRVAAALERAGPWLERCQQADGGFVFTPEPASHNNKAEYRDEQRMLPRSYGTATSDGLLALVHSGVAADDPRLKSAVRWLIDRPGLAVVPGFEELPPETDWQRGLRYYYYASLARALPQFPTADALSCRRTLIQILVKEQKQDGSWVNPSPRMREDDPLIATSLAITTLGTLLDQTETAIVEKAD